MVVTGRLVTVRAERVVRVCCVACVHCAACPLRRIVGMLWAPTMPGRTRSRARNERVRCVRRLGQSLRGVPIGAGRAGRATHATLGRHADLGPAELPNKLRGTAATRLQGHGRLSTARALGARRAPSADSASARITSGSEVRLARARHAAGGASDARGHDGRCVTPPPPPPGKALHPLTELPAWQSSSTSRACCRRASTERSCRLLSA